MRPGDSRKTPYEHIFPPFVAVSTCSDAVKGALYCEEKELLEGVAPSRMIEFTAGRLCAHRALAALGVRGGALLVGADNAPAWPEGIVGSISHTSGFCVAVACRSCDTVGVGVDVERIDRTSWEIAPVLCTAAERSRIDSLPPGGAALLLSAKESLYKAYQPLAGYCLAFGDIDVSFDQDARCFAARLVNDSAPALFGAREFRGRYRVDAVHAYTGLVMPWRERPTQRKPHRPSFRAAHRRPRRIKINGPTAET